MKTAVAAAGSDTDAQVARQAARAPFFLLFDEQGCMLETLSNPFAEIDRAAAPQAAKLLADKGVDLLVAGDFGPRFLEELEVRGIATVQGSGKVAEALQ